DRRPLLQCGHAVATPAESLRSQDMSIRRFIASVMTVAVAMVLTAGPAPADPIGSGWTEIFPNYQLDEPPGLTRHTVTDGVHHMWVLDSDPSKYPGRDSGPHSE